MTLACPRLSHLHEQLAAMHRQDLQHEAEQHRLLGHLPSNQRHTIRHIISRMGTLMIALGTRDQIFEQVARASGQPVPVAPGRDGAAVAAAQSDQLSREGHATAQHST